MGRRLFHVQRKVKVAQTTATIAEVAACLGVSVPRVYALLSQKRLAGARRAGRNRSTWVIPVDMSGKPVILPSKHRSKTFAKISLSPR